ncbi:MAG: TRAP transporter large permease [Halanaerobiales bacterium]|nr:TRAP transporter large permease [Halanaerobiales bacterium]
MIWLLPVFLLSMVVGTPLSFVIGLTALIAFLIGDYPLLMLVQRFFSGLDSFSLMAVPFFILAGNLMNTGGITQKLVDFAHSLVGHIRGGLAHTNIVVSMFFAGITGSAVADTSAIGSILIPAMIKKGYGKGFSAAVTASSSTIGPIIPPSILMVIYGITTGVSIGGLFLAGLIPGILIGLALMVVAYFISVKRDYPQRESMVSLREFLRDFKNAIIPLIAPLIIMGGILIGVFTATEASVIAVAYAFIVSFFVYDELSWSDLPKILLDSAITTGSILLIIGTANILGWIISVEQIDQVIAQVLTSFTGNKYLFLLFINILFLFLGTFMEAGATIIILTPVLAPIAVQLGIDPLHFGFVTVLNLVIGLTTPPLGLCLFVACGIAKIKLKELAIAIYPFILAEIAVLMLVTYFPVFTTWVPSLMGF